MQNPKISVILPVYNSEKYLNEAIESILNQTFVDFEFIIIDDASTDGSLEIIKSYNDPRIVIIENEINKGYVYGLNFAITLAKGEYVARMDSDDVSNLKRFEIQVEFLDKNKNVMLVGSYYQILNTKNIVELPTLHEEIKKEMIFRNAFGHPTVMFRKQFYTKNNFFYDHSKMPAEDFDLWSRMSRKGELANIPLVLLGYRVHETQISNKLSLAQNQISIQIGWVNFLEFILKNYNVTYKSFELNSTNELINRLKFLFYLQCHKEVNFREVENALNFYFYEYREEILLNKNHRNLTSFFKILFLYPNFFNQIKLKSSIAYFFRCIFNFNKDN